MYCIVSDQLSQHRSPNNISGVERVNISECNSKLAQKLPIFNTSIFFSSSSALDLDDIDSAGAVSSTSAVGSDQHREQMLSRAQKMLRSMKSLLAREKTLSITPKKTKTWNPQKSNNKQPSLQLLSQ